MEVSFLYKLENLEEMAEIVLQHLEHKKLLLFYGEMGSGKTTLIKFILKKLNVIDEVTSPTFSIVNEYTTNNDQVLYHFDLYRLKTENEVLDMGFNDYIQYGNICIIEWPEIAMKYLSGKDLLNVQLSHIDSETRKISISTN